MNLCANVLSQIDIGEYLTQSFLVVTLIFLILILISIFNNIYSSILIFYFYSLQIHKDNPACHNNNIIFY